MLNQRNAFTLIELLVVVAIIALLVSILLPSLKEARDLAERSACLGQLHHMGLGFAMYASDNNGCMPMRTGWWSCLYYRQQVGSPHRGTWRNHWLLYGAGYVDAFDMFFCVSNPNTIEEPSSFAAEQSYNITGHYWYLQDAWYSTVIPDDRGIEWENYPGDISCWWYKQVSVNDYPIMIDWCQGRWAGIFGFNHGEEGLNTLFGDGHAAWIDDPKLYEIIEDDALNGDGDWSLPGPQNVWFYIDNNF